MYFINKNFAIKRVDTIEYIIQYLSLYMMYIILFQEIVTRLWNYCYNL